MHSQGVLQNWPLEGTRDNVVYISFAYPLFWHSQGGLEQTPTLTIYYDLYQKRDTSIQFVEGTEAYFSGHACGKGGNSIPLKLSINLLFLTQPIMESRQ